MRLLVLVVGMMLGLLASDAWAGALDRARSSGIIKLGYRDDAAPFSFNNSIGEPAGYSVDLCRQVAEFTAQELGMSSLKVEYVVVSAEARFQALVDGKIDILCGPTSATLSRRKIVDFSIPTFITGASVLFRKDGAQDFQQLANKNVGVRAGTTTETALRNTLKKASIDAKIVPVTNHNHGLAALESRKIDAYFADRAILLYLMLKSKSASQFMLSSKFFTLEPYALAIQRGDTDFRLIVDRVLSHVYRSGQIEIIFKNAFGQQTKPTKLLEALFLSSSLPD